jgi:hypothetical protein
MLEDFDGLALVRIRRRNRKNALVNRRKKKLFPENAEGSTPDATELRGRKGGEPQT